MPLYPSDAVPRSLSFSPALPSLSLPYARPACASRDECSATGALSLLSAARRRGVAQVPPKWGICATHQQLGQTGAESTRGKSLARVQRLGREITQVNDDVSPPGCSMKISPLPFCFPRCPGVRGRRRRRFFSTPWCRGSPSSPLSHDTPCWLSTTHAHDPWL